MDISAWPILGQGGGPHTAYLVEYANPATAPGTIDRVGVVYDLTKGTVLSAYRETMTTTGANYQREDLNPNSLKSSPYCTGTYGCTQ